MSKQRLSYFIPNYNTVYHYHEKLEEFSAKITKVKQIASGYNHTILLDDKDNLYSFGDNTDGQLGLNNVEKSKQFRKIDSSVVKNIKLITCNGYGSFILNFNNELFGTGLTFLADQCKQFMKIDFKEDNEIVKLTSGGGITLLMNDRGELFGGGLHNFCELGFESEKVNERHKLQKLNIPLNIVGKIKNFYCRFSTIILTNDGEIFCPGRVFEQKTESGTCCKKFTKLNLNFVCKDVMYCYADIYFLTNDNKLYNFEQKELDLKSIKINKIISGFNDNPHILTENNQIATFKPGTKEFIVLDEKYDLPHVFISMQSEAFIVCNSTYPIEELSFEGGKEVKRMISMLLLNQTTTTFCDVDFIIVNY